MVALGLTDLFGSTTTSELIRRKSNVHLLDSKDIPTKCSNASQYILMLRAMRAIARKNP